MKSGDVTDFLISHRSHPARGAWIEIIIQKTIPAKTVSHPARGAWIEIGMPLVDTYLIQVAPRKGCVD